MRHTTIAPQFIESVPERLEDGTLYISQKYGMAIHKCCCGCGEEVVTPLTPAKWQLQIEGGLISLYPSIGNWSFQCKSHYWIIMNRVEWAPTMSNRQIQYVQDKDIRDTERYIALKNAKNAAPQSNILNYFIKVWAWIYHWWNRR